MLRLWLQDIYRLDLEDEERCREAVLRLEELKLLRQRQEKAKLQLAAVLLDKSSSPFLLARSLNLALTEAYACELTADCEQVRAAVELLEQVAEQTKEVELV